ncbi:hypothetical protein ISN45_At05g035290 [Arabidopsis thaliana x Arabidopsis arenosa]|uniref:Uncharacterized protein n=1 Tax=Arabidopsis thaliana x Arabidopsis arenosa TaxID=1240361 RepID=A0A8T2D112_9BRAS|nr:hypothetical protein ISN45_At05g035290 [Arabidopsis thaliana x Arabidopsis arenosa]
MFRIIIIFLGDISWELGSDIFSRWTVLGHWACLGSLNY